MAEIAPYQQRVRDEALELQNKLVKLLVFQRSVMFKEVDYSERTRLVEQAALMHRYYTVLCERIVHFNDTQET